MTKKIMFVCTGNTCRSAMAEALAKEIFKDYDSIEIISRGTSVYFESKANENAIKTMSIRGIDLDNHIAKQVLIEDIEENNFVFTMTNHQKQILTNLSPKHSNKIFTLAQFAGAHIDIEDPFGLDLDVYNTCADTIEKNIYIIKNNLQGRF